MDKTTAPQFTMPNTDSVSALIQLHAKRAGLEFRWSGNGRQDLDLLCVDCSNKTLLSRQLWNGLKELMEMKEFKELPEPIQAQITSIILKARAMFELSLEKRNKLAQSMLPQPTQPAAPQGTL